MKKRFEALDSFRGICAIAVAFYHMHIMGAFTESTFIRGSDIFVEFFFVLSGFVLAHGYGHKFKLDFVEFMKARFFRLFPLHVFMLAVFITLEFFKLAAFTYTDIAFENAPFTNKFAPVEIIPNLALIHSWTSFTNHLSFNYPSWSISVEFYMYAIFFATVVFAKSYRTLIWFSVSLVMFILLINQSELFVDAVVRGISCFFGGAFVYWVYTQLPSVNCSKTLATAIELALLICIFFVVKNKFELRALLGPILFLFTVFWFAYELGAISKALSFWLFQLAGKLSYSIYMTHAAFIFVATSFALVFQKLSGFKLTVALQGKQYMDIGPYWANNLLAVFMILVVFVVSIFTHRYIELWGQNLGRRLYRKSSR